MRSSTPNVEPRRGALLGRALLLGSLSLSSACIGKAAEEAPGLLDRLLGILVSPDAALLPVGSSLQLEAMGLLDERDTTDLTTAATWKINDDSIATVGHSEGKEGLLRGKAVGTATLWAELEGIRSPNVQVEVIDAGLDRLSVSPDSVELSPGDEVQLQAWARFSDGSEGEVSTQVQWSVADTNIATLDSSGLLHAENEGETQVHASWEGLDSGPVTVVVEESSSGQNGIDLTVVSASGSLSGGSLDLSVTIKNTGTSSATDFWVDLFVNPSSNPSVGDTGDDFTWVSYLAGGSTDTLEFQVPVSGSSAKITIFVDSTGDVSETDESDNLWSASVSSSGGSEDGPDLVPTYFDYLVDHYSIYYYVEVTNQGDEAADWFYVDVFLNESAAPGVPGDGDDYATMSGLSAGETDYVDFLLDHWCSYCESWTLIDSYDNVVESDESNNTDGPMVVISP